MNREDEDASKITVSIWHNVAHDAEGRHIAMLDGYQPGDPVVRVFTYQADPAGRDPEQIAEEAFAVAATGWTLVLGGMTVVRTSEHGTRPLPAPVPAAVQAGTEESPNPVRRY